MKTLVILFATIGAAQATELPVPTQVESLQTSSGLVINRQMSLKILTRYHLVFFRIILGICCKMT